MQLSLSIDEAAQACSIGRTKLYAAINCGALKARKLGRRTIIAKADLESFITGLQEYRATKEAGQSS